MTVCILGILKKRISPNRLASQMIEFLIAALITGDSILNSKMLKNSESNIVKFCFDALVSIFIEKLIVLFFSIL